MAVMVGHAITYEAAHQASKKSQGFTAPTTDEVHDISQRRTWNKPKRQFAGPGAGGSNQAPGNKAAQGRCNYCGKDHPIGRTARMTQCPAYGKVCGNCGKQNHFRAVCKQPPQQNQQNGTGGGGNNTVNYMDSTDTSAPQGDDLWNYTRTEYRSDN